MARQKQRERWKQEVEAARAQVRQFQAPALASTLVGVRAVTGVRHWSTLKRWRKLGFPVRRGPDQRVFVVVPEVKAWLLAFHHLQQARTNARLEAFSSTFTSPASSLSASAETKRLSTVKVQPAGQPSRGKGWSQGDH